MAQDEGIISVLNRILAAAVREKASDIYIKADSPPILRIEGELYPIDLENFTASLTEELARQLMRPHEWENFKKKPEANLVYQMPELGRFRINIYLQRSTHALVFRKVRDDVLDFEVLNLPPVLKSMALWKRGLVLVTGPTGSGKSTTLATMIKFRNENTTGHIVTIEDPIEFIHPDLKCIVSQREVSSDTMNFNDALESAVRQAPDVLLIGEMRDIDSVRAGVYFAETGHLVLSSLHSNNAIQTIERLLQFFPTDIHEGIFQQLAINLRAVISQRLIPKKDGTGRVAAIEIMVVNARVAELLNDGNLTQIRRELDQFHPDGMQSFDFALIELFKQGIITPEDCVRNSDNANDMKLKLKSLPTHIRSSGREDERYA